MLMTDRGVYDEPGGGPPGGPGHGPRSMRIDIVSIFLYIMAIALGMAIQVTRQYMNKNALLPIPQPSEFLTSY